MGRLVGDPQTGRLVNQEPFLGELAEEDIPTSIYHRPKSAMVKPDPATIIYGGTVVIFGTILLMCGYMLYRVMFG